MVNRTTKPPTITGNYFNKHQSNNYIVRRLVERYRVGLQSLVGDLPVNSVFEVGSGEGYILQYISSQCPGRKIVGSDINQRTVQESWSRLLEFEWLVTVGESIPFPPNAFDLTVCCEVLEHVEQPELVIQELTRVTNKYLIVSVPHEPYWRILNVLRGKYWKRFGNTPGHLNHWNTIGIKRMIGGSLSVVKVLHVFPWIFILAKK